MNALTRRAAACASVLLWVTGIPGHTGPAAEIAVDWPRVLGGEVIVQTVQTRDGVPGVRAVFAVTAPRERIWAVLLDYGNFPKIFEGIAKMHVLSQDERGAVIEYWVDAVVRDYHYVLARAYEAPGRRLTWKRTAGDLERIEGSWEILDAPRPGVHLLVYESFVKVGGVVPSRVVRWPAMARAREMGERLRAWIERKSP